MECKKVSVYKKVLEQNLPRLLSLFNTDVFSETYGFVDREFWGWKTKDFPNGTLQGGVHSLAIALKLGLFDNHQNDAILKIIDAAIKAIEKIRAANGSMVEAYPQENSFCVTALVAFDLLSAIEHIHEKLDNQTLQVYLGIIRPLIDFITNHGEEHAVISNHLATAVAAVYLWNQLSHEKNPRGDELLERIYSFQSSEGWYLEYEGADPGYQTLCTYYLGCAYRIKKTQKLLESLTKSAVFLKYFIHPDGTIGGLYGSRNTEVYYPGGIVYLADTIDDFATLAYYLTPNSQHIMPQDIDIGNFIPLLNSYAVAALYESQQKYGVREPFYQTIGSKIFPDTGIYLHSNENYFAIVNYKKGGTLKVFNKRTGQIDLEDGGLFGRVANGTKFSTQQFDQDAIFENHTVQSSFYKINDTYPSALTFIILRILSLSLFKSVWLGNVFKKFIVDMLMTGKKKLDGKAIRFFVFENDKVIIHEQINAPSSTETIGHYGKTKAIHMASSGYYLPQNNFNTRSDLVEYIHD